MPYKNNELRSDYQKRTASPYMAEWREKNREKLRKYMKEWSAKRRANDTKRQKDKVKAELSGSTQRQKDFCKKRQKEWVDELSDDYIIGLLSRRGSLTRELAKENPEIIELHRTILLTKRKLKNHDNNSNQFF